MTRLSFAGIDRVVRPDVLVALAVAVGVDDDRRPALRLGRVAGLEELSSSSASRPRRSAGPPWLNHSVLSRPWRNRGGASQKQVIDVVPLLASSGRRPRAGAAIRSSGAPWPTDGPSPSCRSPGCRGPRKRAREPDAALLVHHRVVDAGVSRPRSAPCPSRREGCIGRLVEDGVPGWHRMLDGERAVLHRIEHRDVVGALLRRAVDRAVRR